MPLMLFFSCRTVLPAAKAITKTVGKSALKASRSGVARELKRAGTEALIDTALDSLSGKDMGASGEKHFKKAATSVLKQAKRRPKPKRKTKKPRVRVPLYDESD